MRDYATALGAIAFIAGLLLVGLSGNRRMRLKVLAFSVGALLIAAGTVAELTGLIATRGGGGGGGSDAAQG